MKKIDFYPNGLELMWPDPWMTSETGIWHIEVRLLVNSFSCVNSREFIFIHFGTVETSRISIQRLLIFANLFWAFPAVSLTLQPF